MSASFYPLTPEVAEKLRCAKLTAAEWRLWSYLIEIDPWGDSYQNLQDTLAVMEKVDIKKSTFYAAIAKFQKFEVLPEHTASLLKKSNYSYPEQQVRNSLKSRLGGQIEVVTAVGRIDLLTESELIEVKAVNSWKEALGQILAYSAFFPEYQKRIHLFGYCTPDKADLIESTCLEFGVVVSFEVGGDYCG
ncbi:hypothetical protein NIES4074_61690 (plasmid) [Cylindrospermum sp. NIES-4074]|nr:hypothetical protein NIES4074_61690 [Cylindrospermum sp. NIES-4074]